MLSTFAFLGEPEDDAVIADLFTGMKRGDVAPKMGGVLRFAFLVTMADGLNKVGFLKWFAGGAAAALSGYSVMTIVIALTVIYFVVHYMFASLTAHTTALLPVLLTAAIAVPEMPVKLISLLFCYTLGLMGIISPYATGPGPIYYGSGYVSRKDFWMLGLIFGAIYLAVLLVIGVPYLRYYLS